MGKTAEWFAEQYKRYKVSLLKVAMLELDNYAVAEEIVQEVYWRLLLECRKGIVIQYPGKWMFTVLDNLIKNEVRRAKYKYEIPLDPGYVPAVVQGPEENLKLEDILPAGLKNHEREILILYYEKNWSHKEIGEYYRCGEHSSHMRLHRARERCKVLMLSEKNSQDKREHLKK